MGQLHARQVNTIPLPAELQERSQPLEKQVALLNFGADVVED